jgi:hypothetical protein
MRRLQDITRNGVTDSLRWRRLAVRNIHHAVPINVLVRQIPDSVLIQIPAGNTIGTIGTVSTSSTSSTSSTRRPVITFTS